MCRHTWALAFHEVNDTTDDAPPAVHAAEVCPPSIKPRYRPDIQGLRAIAVLLVVIYHSGFGLPGGFLGVDVFFVISGYVIGRLLLHEHSTTGRIALGAFYARRVRRLLPALGAMLVFVGIVAIPGLSPIGDIRTSTMQIGIGAALYISNVALLVFQKVGYFDLSATNNPLLHTWTLGVEEQFYVFFPLLLLLAASLGRRIRTSFRRVVIAALVALAIVSFVVGSVLSGSVVQQVGSLPSASRIAFYASPTRAWEFLIGVLLVFVEPMMRRLRPGVVHLLCIVGVAAIVGSAFVFDEFSPTPGPTTLVPVIGSALVILAGSVVAGALQRLLASRLFVWIGDRSYGWYLWHWPIIVFVRTSFPTAPTWVILVAALGALVPTEISYRFLETPIRHDPKWIGRRALRLVGVSTAVSIFALVLLVAFPSGFAPGVKAVEAAQRPQATGPTGCLVTDGTDDPKAEYHCTWAVRNPTKKIVMVGDSHTGALAEVMGFEARRAGYELSVAWRPGCPFADADRVYRDPGLTKDCRAFVERTMRAIRLTHPDLVILASRQSSLVHLDEFVLGDPHTGVIGRTEPEKARIWQDGLTRTLSDFSQWNIPSVVIATVPQLAPFNAGLCPAWRMWVNPQSCARTLSRSRVDDYRRASLKATKNAVATLGSRARLVDFTNDLCAPGKCSTYRDGKWLYSDSTHVSRLGAMTLGPTIQREVLPFASSH